MDDGTVKDYGVRLGAALLIVVLAMGLTMAVSYNVAINGTVSVETDTGLAVTWTDDDIESGNPFVNASAVKLRNTTFGANGNSDLTVDAFEAGSANWTNVSSVTLNGNELLIDHASKRRINITGQVTTFRYRELNLSENSGAQDAYIDSVGGATPSVTIYNTGLAEGTGVVAVDTQTGEALDSAAVKKDGSVVLDELPDAEHNVNFKVGPSTLEIYKETRASQLLKNATVRVRFFEDGEQTVIQRSTSDGTLDLTGVPSDTPITISAVNESDNSTYYYRRIRIENTENQQEIYLLKKSTQAFNITFINNDETGLFPPSTTALYIKKPITKDFDGDGTNETRYQVISGDLFGGGGSYTATLAADNRYQLVLKSPEETRSVGPYVVRQPEVVNIQPKASPFTLNTSDSYDYEAEFVNTSTDERIVFRYTDPANETRGLEVNIYEQGNRSNNFPNQTFSGPVGSVQVSQTLTQEQSNQTWVVEFTAQRKDKAISGSQVVGQNIRAVFPNMAPWLGQAIAMLFLIMTGALFSQLNHATGAVATALVGGGFWFIGMLSAEAGGAVVVALAIAVLYKTQRRSV